VLASELAVFVAGLVIGAALFVVGVLDRPRGQKVTYGWWFGLLENSTLRGRVVGYLGLAIFIVLLLFFMPRL
jgi:hypothetical protein